jgi:hypothetical protein
VDGGGIGCDTVIVVDALLTIAAVAVCGGMIWLAVRIEPHYVSRDGRRMVARMQGLGQYDLPEGRWREMRIRVDGNRLTVTARGVRGMPLRGQYTVQGKSPEPPRRRELYILVGERKALLRVPSSSRAVDVLDAMISRGTPENG